MFLVPVLNHQESGKEPMISRVKGTITHIAPERFLDANCVPNTKTDVYR